MHLTSTTTNFINTNSISVQPNPFNPPSRPKKVCYWVDEDYEVFAIKRSALTSMEPGKNPPELTQSSPHPPVTETRRALETNQPKRAPSSSSVTESTSPYIFSRNEYESYAKPDSVEKAALSDAEPQTQTPEQTPQLVDDKKKITRPHNSFMLYRMDHKQALIKENPNINNREISQILGERWQNESEEVKKEYQRKAEEGRRQHALNHPGWVYRPKRKSVANTATPRDKSNSVHFVFEDFSQFSRNRKEPKSKRKRDSPPASPIPSQKSLNSGADASPKSFTSMYPHLAASDIPLASRILDYASTRFQSEDESNATEPATEACINSNSQQPMCNLMNPSIDLGTILTQLELHINASARNRSDLKKDDRPTGDSKRIKTGSGSLDSTIKRRFSFP
ncbi:hypothetical protein HK098_006980 [Nowakowskiella sp. JEL0407]|nr:hypothetical protein HK098_006980 [Nowakowskiella sp. JEL0407]